MRTLFFISLLLVSAWKVSAQEGKAFPEVKRTEYEGVGHGISRFPFNNEQLMSWLFNQKLP